MENKEVYGYIYLITNLINGKQYIGQTVRTIKIRFGCHCSSKDPVISKAIKKYGIENFITQELAIAYNQKELDFLEGLYMSWFETLTPNGYNIIKIINGKGRHSEETIEKMKIINNLPERLKQSSELGIKTRGKTRNKSSSKYVGVCVQNNRYLSQIRFNNKTFYLGRYKIESDAAKAYDLKAIELFGYDCILNFPELRSDYINNKIFIKKCSKHDNSKSGIKGVWFDKRYSKWFLEYFDKNLNKNKYKYFEILEDAIKFKENIEDINIK